MTGPRERQAEAADPEVKPGVIEDLDVTDDDARDIAGGVRKASGDAPFEYQAE